MPALGVKSVRLETLELTVTGDRAAEIGQAMLALESGPAALKYIVLWQRRADGAWQWQADIWNNGAAR